MEAANDFSSQHFFSFGGGIASLWTFTGTDQMSSSFLDTSPRNTCVRVGGLFGRRPLGRRRGERES